MEKANKPYFEICHISNGNYKIKLITKSWWKFIKNNRLLTEDIKFVFDIDISGYYISCLFYEYATDNKCIFTKNNALKFIEELEAIIVLKTLEKN